MSEDNNGSPQIPSLDEIARNLSKPITRELPHPERVAGSRVVAEMLLGLAIHLMTREQKQALLPLVRRIRTRLNAIALQRFKVSRRISHRFAGMLQVLDDTRSLLEVSDSG